MNACRSTHRLLRTVLLGGAAVPILLAGPAVDARAQACPASDVQLLQVPFATGEFPVDAAQYDSSLSESGFLTAHAAFDLVAGTVEVTHGEIYPGETSVRARDTFDVTGVVPGTHVVLTAEFVVDGTVTTTGCGGSGCTGGLAAFIDANGSQAMEGGGGPQFGAGTLAFHLAPRLAIDFTAGTPVAVAFRLLGAHAPGGNHRVDVAGTYRFIDLPPGVGVISCRGLVGSPTPALPASWGRVKAAYR